MPAGVEPKLCDHDTCHEPAFACRLQYWNEEPESYYCAEHAPEHGFCCVCGLFWAGIESFEFKHPGICDNCYEDVRDC